MDQYQVLLLTQKITFFFFNQDIKVTKFKYSLSLLLKNFILFRMFGWYSKIVSISITKWSHLSKYN